jgi:hypothetical protein
MPFACEDCGEMGARMNALFEIRLCVECSKSAKYKLICKSKAQSVYLLSKTDFNTILPNPPKEYLVKNPHYKSGPPMTLYLETEIQQLFLSKYNELITNILIILNPLDNIENTIDLVKNYFEEKKNSKKQEKYDKILSKYYIGDESELPKWVQEQLFDVKSGAEYERIISSYFRFINLCELLKKENLYKYIDHKISHEYIYQTDTQIKIQHVPIILRYILHKKKQMIEVVNKNNIDKSKYSKEISQYINSFDPDIELTFNPIVKTISNDLDTLIEYINRREKSDKERKSRTKELTDKLKIRGLVLRSDSVLCSNYIGGSNEYTPDEIVDIMEQMEWFFTNTKYSIYSKDYDNKQYQLNKSSWYDYEDRQFNRRYYDDDDDYDYDLDDSDDYDYESKEKAKQDYNKTKSEYVKNKCLKEWILNGKKGIYPKSLIPKIDQLEKELEEEKNKPIIIKQQKQTCTKSKINTCTKSKTNTQTQSQIHKTPKTHPCSNSECSNIHSLQCINKMCRSCCDGNECNIHMYKIKQ